MTDTFSSIPIVDFSRLQNPPTKEETLEQLRDAIFRVGFLYLTNHGLEVSRFVYASVMAEAHELGIDQTRSCYSAGSVCLVR